MENAAYRKPIRLSNGEYTYLKYLVERQRADIEKCFPGINLDDGLFAKANSAYIVACNGNPVGITIGKNDGDEINLLLDYSFPEFRDFSIGAFLLKKLKEEGIYKVIYLGPTENHMTYLNKMGFSSANGRFERKL